MKRNFIVKYFLATIICLFSAISWIIWNRDVALYSPSSSLIALVCGFLVIVVTMSFGISMILTNLKEHAKYKQQTRHKHLLLLAVAFNGKLTVVEVTRNSDYSLAEAASALHFLAARNYAKVEISPEGAEEYRFPGIISNKEKQKKHTLNGLLD